jgi:hypothetical protein
MSDQGILNFLGSQVAVFEAIKAKHQNIHAYHSKTSDPVLSELADMILLFSAQVALLGASPAHGEARPERGRHQTASLLRRA